MEEMIVALKVVAEEKKIPDRWAGNDKISMYKWKINVLECSKYRSLRLLEYGLKTLEKVHDTKLNGRCKGNTCLLYADSISRVRVVLGTVRGIPYICGRALSFGPQSSSPHSGDQ